MLVVTNLFFKYFYRATRAVYPNIEKVSTLHPQNKEIKKSRRALLRSIKGLERTAWSTLKNIKIGCWDYTYFIGISLVSFANSSFNAILTSRFLQNLAFKAQLFLKAFIADGVRYFRGLLIFFGVDALIIDDEPL